jgi:hypothetical protein
MCPSCSSRVTTLEAQGATVYRNAQEMASAWMRNVRSRSPIMLRSQHVRVATTRGRGSEAQTGSSSFSARFNVRLRRLLYIQPGCRSLLRHHTLCLLLCVLAAHQGGPRHEGSPRPRLIRLLRHHTTVSPLTSHRHHGTHESSTQGRVECIVRLGRQLYILISAGYPARRSL